MKKVFEYVLLTSNIISWLALFFVFGIDDTKSEINFDKLILIVAGVILFWAAMQLITACFYSNKKDCSNEEQPDAERQAKLDARKKEQESMEHAYHVAVMCRVDKLIELTSQK